MLALIHRCLGVQNEVTDPHLQVTLQRHTGHFLPAGIQINPAFPAPEGDHCTIAEIEGNLRHVYHDLATVFRVTGLARHDLPDFFAVTHFDATEVLYALVCLRKHADGQLLQPLLAVSLRSHGYGQVVGDCDKH